MADEFQAGVCSGNWWTNSTRSGYNLVSSPCSTAINDVGSFGWPTEMVEVRTRSSEDSASVSDSSIVFQDTQKLQEMDSGCILMDSTLPMMDFGLSSPTIDWNQALLRSGRTESNFRHMILEDSSSRPNFLHEKGVESAQIQKDWNNFSGGSEDSSITAFKPVTQVFALDQEPLNSDNSSGECTVTCQGLATSFPMGSASYGYSSALLPGLFEPDPRPQQYPIDNRSVNYTSPVNYRTNSNEFSTSWSEFSQFLKPSPSKQQTSNQLQFSNNGRFWNATVPAMNDTRSSFLPSQQTQFVTPTFEVKPNRSNLGTKTTREEGRDSRSGVKKSNSETSTKRPRIETPSPLPTFKVRKEKLGDRITALQQLVSPFGKTDTASVLFEATDYIKFLHEQVSVLSTPYLKNGAPTQHYQSFDKSMEGEGPKQDLRSRGLCLMPISSTFPVTNETTADFWTPTFGGTYR